jgi:hypothetical protein
MSTDQIRALCAELAQELAEEYGVQREFNAGDPLLGSGAIELLSRARTALAQPELEGPTDEELDKVIFQAVWDHMDDADDLSNDEMDRLKARAVLARWSHPAVEPVPVAERLPGPEDCDAKGRCWWWCHRHESWELDAVPVHYRHWLPHHALPIPTP